MRVTHVIRGDDHINNTPRQINMLRGARRRAAGLRARADDPGPDGTKLSKRHGAVSVLQYRDEGFLPEALLNYLGAARLVARRPGDLHARGDDRGYFDIARRQQVARRRSTRTSCCGLNQQHILRATPGAARRLPEPQLTALGLPALIRRASSRWRAPSRNARKRCSKWRATASFSSATPSSTTTGRPQAPGCRSLAAADSCACAPPPGSSPGRRRRSTTPSPRRRSEQGVALGKVAQPVRVAVAGGPVSPPIDITLRDPLAGRVPRTARTRQSSSRSARRDRRLIDRLADDVRRPRFPVPSSA